MNKNTIKYFFSNKEFFLAVGVFAGLFVLVALAYLFANGGTGGHNKGFKGFSCTPDVDTCKGGIRIFEDEITKKVTDGCEKNWFTGNCSGTCFWCEPSDDIGSYCKEAENETCVVTVPHSTMSCGEQHPYVCVEGGGHGLKGCCPEDNMPTEPKGVCKGITHCLYTGSQK